MALSVHDNVLVSYEVRSEERRIVVHTECRFAAPVERIQVVFVGVEAYHFKQDALHHGNIVFDVETVRVEDVLQEHWADIEGSSPFMTWPWAADRESAPHALRALGLSGFLLTSSVGLVGWVLARSAALVPEAKPLGVAIAGDEPGLYALTADGARSRLKGRRLVVAFGDGRELVLSLPEHPWPADAVYLRSTFAGPGGDAHLELGGGPRAEVWGMLVFHPGGGNVMRVLVEARGHGGQLVAGRLPPDAKPLPKSFFVVDGEQRTAVERGTYLLDLGEGRVLCVDPHWQRGDERDGVYLFAGPPPTQQERERLRAGGPRLSTHVTVEFGGVNVAHVRLSKPYEARAIEPVAQRPVS